MVLTICSRNVYPIYETQIMSCLWCGSGAGTGKVLWFDKPINLFFTLLEGIIENTAACLLGSVWISLVAHQFFFGELHETYSGGEKLINFWIFLLILVKTRWWPKIRVLGDRGWVGVWNFILILLLAVIFKMAAIFAQMDIANPAPIHCFFSPFLHIMPPASFCLSTHMHIFMG